ncbi:MAG: TMEM175 family protein [Chitinophagaceae bacterium]
MEAFSDGVIAIIITIMVLEIKVPHSGDLASLETLIPVFLSYVLSFIYVGIYWNNHRHLMQAVHHIDGSVLWANIHLIFWLSLTPFASA